MKKRKIIVILFSLFSLLSMVACNTEAPDDFDDFEEPSQTVINTINLNEYESDNYLFDNSISNENGSVSYEVFVRSFYDSNNDGIGDLNGVKAKLPYFKDLGIKTLWLMPIMPSPTYHGYDVTDYYDINSDYGTMADFEALTTEAEKYNIDIMIDIVFNHSSTSHPWFKQSYQDYIDNNSLADSKADWYCWSDTRKNQYYSYASNSSIFYEARFDYTMPDFNTKNEAVRSEMVNILNFWVSKGVKGFRFDAVKYYEYENVAYNTEFLTFIRDSVVNEHPGIYFVGECWDNIGIINNYYKSTFDSFFKFNASIEGRGDESLISQAKGLSSSMSFGAAIERQEKLMKENNPNGYSSYFISNHDMDRAAKSLEGNNAKIAASLTYLLPGTPFIYYGEEICMKGERKTSPDDASDVRRRLPMVWSSKDKTGECQFPEASRPDLNKNNTQVTLGATDAQATNYSVWNHYKKVIQIRNKYPFIKQSIFTNRTQDIVTNYDNVLAYELSYNDESIIIIHNFKGVNVEIDVSKLGITKIADEISVSKLTPELANNKLKLGRQSTVILTK